MPRNRMVGSCTAVCALTKLRCRLPAHSEDVEHSNERGKFRLVAVPGQTTFAHRDALDAMATRANGIGFSDKLNEAAVEHGASRRERRRVGLSVAHRGVPTTAGDNEKASDVRSNHG